MVGRFLICLLLWWLYDKGTRQLFRSCIVAVKNEPGIPNYGRPSGQDARRDMACEYAKTILPEMKDSLINLGMELTYLAGRGL